MTPQNVRNGAWRFVANVEAVNPDTNQVSLWIEHDDIIVTIDIPPNMPKWAKVAGEAFRAWIPASQHWPENYNNLTWLYFEPLDFGWLTPDEMMDILEGKTPSSEMRQAPQGWYEKYKD